MKPTFGWALCWLTLTLADLVGAADSMSAALDCSVLKLSLAGDQRIEVSSHRFSILPPQGESWCLFSSNSLRVTFFRIPPRAEGLETVPSPNEFFRALQAGGFMGVAAALVHFGADIESPYELKIAVDRMIIGHFFSQFIGGIASAERRFQLLESHSSIDGSVGANCARFDAKVKAWGLRGAPPNSVMVLNFSNNLICTHPQPVSKNILVWISVVELYREGEQSNADKVRREVEPFLHSLQFPTLLQQ
jgi:hypothetical protein